MSFGDKPLGQSKVDGATPVSADFWEQFTRDWAFHKYIGNVTSIFFWVTGVRSLAFRLIKFIESSRDEEEAKEELMYHVGKIEPLITWLDKWLYECLDVPTIVRGRPQMRKIGFFHLRRQNVMPIGFEMRVILEGFSAPVANEEYSKMRSTALYGVEENGKRVGGVVNICVEIESHFHHIIKIQTQQPLFFESETIDIGDEQERKTLDDVAKLTESEKIKKEVERLKTLNLEEEL